MGKAKVANRTREIRLSGMTWGACGNVGYGGIRNPLHIPKGCMSETLCLTLCAPQFYPNEAGHNVYLEGTMGDAPGSQTISMKLQRIAHLGQQKLCAKRESYLFG